MADRREPEPSRPGAAEEGPSKRLDVAFRISVVLKGLDGLLETIGGIVLFFVSPASINHLARWATAHELAQDPHDFIARHILHSASQLTTSSTVYAAVYLLLHGVTKVVLVMLVLKGKLWAYPWLIALLGAFVVYQTYRLTQKPSAGLIALTLFDILVAVLTWREYRDRRAEQARTAAAAPA
ncbi:MAG TPA: DUF2127 domain-containing protein [Acidimicrobiales bacterium]|nr:DUF2127 domain-containing protein [Acidimicrobiales bacterium]